MKVRFSVELPSVPKEIKKDEPPFKFPNLLLPQFISPVKGRNSAGTCYSHSFLIFSSFYLLSFSKEKPYQKHLSRDFFGRSKAFTFIPFAHIGSGSCSQLFVPKSVFSPFWKVTLRQTLILNSFISFDKNYKSIFMKWPKAIFFNVTFLVEFLRIHSLILRSIFASVLAFFLKVQLFSECFWIAISLTATRRNLETINGTVLLSSYRNAC